PRRCPHGRGTAGLGVLPARHFARGRTGRRTARACHRDGPLGTTRGPVPARLLGPAPASRRAAVDRAQPPLLEPRLLLARLRRLAGRRVRASVRRATARAVAGIGSRLGGDHLRAGLDRRIIPRPPPTSPPPP